MGSEDLSAAPYFLEFDTETILQSSSSMTLEGMVDSSFETSDSECSSASPGSKHHLGSSLRITALSAAINCLESFHLPTFLKRDDSKDTPVIGGLNRVLLGTQPAWEAVTIMGNHPPRCLCYIISGSFCDVVQLAMDVILHLVLHVPDPSVCWALGFGLSIVFRHTSHRYLVFGDYVGGYWHSLGRIYTGYSGIFILSTIFNCIMTRTAQLPHYIAWVSTWLCTAIVNYFLLKGSCCIGGGRSGSDKRTTVTQKIIRAKSSEDFQDVLVSPRAEATTLGQHHIMMMHTA